MLQYLILNNRIEAAYKYKQISQLNYQEQLLLNFNRGKRQQFFKLFSLFKQQSKLEFYLRVYFLIYTIHPSIKIKTTIPQQQINSFKDYLNNKGSQLAKTNQFLQFYALPFIKKHLQHPAFKLIFKKQWIINLREKLKIFLDNQQIRMRQQINKLLSINQKLQINSNKLQSIKIKQMQNINKQLFQQVKQFTNKYYQLQQNHQSMIDTFNHHMIQSQSKWFQITKQLVNCSKTLIDMIIQKNSQIIAQRKFIKIRKRIQKYQKFVNRKFDDLISQSQDISIFDRHSQNQLSCTVTPYSQKNITTFLSVQQYIPTDFLTLKQDFQKMKIQQKKLILLGISWRILRSKNSIVRKQNLIGLNLNDFLGFESNSIISLLTNKQLKSITLQLLSYISQDSYTQKIIFKSNNKIYQILINLIKQIDNQQNLQYLWIIFQQLSHIKIHNNNLIQHGLIKISLQLLRQNYIKINQNILQNILGCLLNFSSCKKGILMFQKQYDIIKILTQYFKNQYSPMTRVFSNGILYTLIKYSQKIFKLANNFNLMNYIQQIIRYDQYANINQLNTLKQLINNHQFLQQQFIQDIQEIQDDDSINFQDNQHQNLQQMIKGHQLITNKYMLMGRQAIKQSQQVKHILNKFLHKIKLNQQPKLQDKKKQISQKNKKNEKIIKSQKQDYKSPKIKEQKYQKKQKNIPYSDRFQGKSQIIKHNNYLGQKNVNQPQQIINTRNHHTFRIQQKDKSKKSGKQQNKIKKSSSIQKNIGTSYRKEKQSDFQQYQFGNVTEFKAVEEKNYRSPQQKKSRQQVLRQLNEQLRAQKKNQKKQQKNKTNDKTNHQLRQNRLMAAPKNQSQINNPDYVEVFQSRPKIRRTPPKD